METQCILLLFPLSFIQIQGFPNNSSFPNIYIYLYRYIYYTKILKFTLTLSCVLSVCILINAFHNDFLKVTQLPQKTNRHVIGLSAPCQAHFKYYFCKNAVSRGAQVVHSVGRQTFDLSTGLGLRVTSSIPALGSMNEAY